MGLLRYLLIDRPRQQREQERHEAAMEYIENQRSALERLNELDEYDPFPYLGGEGALPIGGAQQGGAALPEAITAGLDQGALSFVKAYGASESSNRTDAKRTNKDGKSYGGFLQFGEARLKDLGINVSIDDFINDTDLQKEATIKHVAMMEREIEDNGLDRYIGTEVAGIPVTETGLKGVIHLAGVGGAKALLERGVSRADELGTSALDYLAKGARAEINTPQPKLEQAPPSQRVSVAEGDDQWESEFYTWDDLKNSRYANAVMDPETGRFLDQITAQFGKKLTFNQTFRPDTKEERERLRKQGAKPAKNSAHHTGEAADISIRGLAEPEIQRLIKIGVANGATGIGLYEGHLHFDTKGSTIRTWGSKYWDKGRKAALEAGKKARELGVPADADLDEVVNAGLPRDTSDIGTLQPGEEVPQTRREVNAIRQQAGVDPVTGEQAAPVQRTQYSPQQMKEMSQQFRQRQGGALDPKLEGVGLKTFQVGYLGNEWSAKRKAALAAAAKTGDYDLYAKMVDKIDSMERSNLTGALQDAMTNIAMGNKAAAIENLKKFSFWLNDGAVPVFDLDRRGNIVVQNRDKNGKPIGHPYIADEDMLSKARTSLLNAKDFASLYYQNEDRDRRFEWAKRETQMRMNKTAMQIEREITGERRDVERHNADMMVKFLTAKENEMALREEAGQMPEREKRLLDDINQTIEDTHPQKLVTNKDELGGETTEMVDVPMTPELAAAQGMIAFIAHQIGLENPGISGRAAVGLATALQGGLTANTGLEFTPDGNMSMYGVRVKLSSELRQLLGGIAARAANPAAPAAQGPSAGTAAPAGGPPVQQSPGEQAGLPTPGAPPPTTGVPAPVSAPGQAGVIPVLPNLVRAGAGMARDLIQ